MRLRILPLIIIFSLVNTLVCGFSYKEGILPFDSATLNHEFPETYNNDKVYTPITYEAYFKAERALFGYYPKFNPAYVSFDPSGKAYLAYGSTKIQYLDKSGNWKFVNITSLLKTFLFKKMRLLEFELCNSGNINEPAIRFDNDGDAYILYHGVGKLRNGTSNYIAILLHCRGGILGDKSKWSFYQLPYSFGRFEKVDGHNSDCLKHPPVLMLSSGYSPSTNYIMIPKKNSNGTISLPPAVKIDNNCISFSYHSGDGNSAITYNDKVFIVYAKFSDKSKKSLGKTKNKGVPTYVVTYDIKQKLLGKARLICYGGENPDDNHNWPAITIDSKGILHVISNGHNAPFRYTHSLSSYITQGQWSEPIEVSNGTTYGSLNCDVNDNLYVISRCSNPNYFFRLTLHRNPPGKNWEPDRHLVIPYKAYYKVWRHRVAWNPVSQRLFLGYYAQSPSVSLFRDDYLAYLNIYPDRKLSFQTENNKVPIGTALSPQPRKYELYHSAPHNEFCMLVSEDEGKKWRIALSKDFVVFE